MATYVGTNGNDDIRTAPDDLNDVYYLLDGDDYLRSMFLGESHIEGGRGNDMLSLADGAVFGVYGYVSGGFGDDFLIGGQRADHGDELHGDAGNDIIIGGKPLTLTPVSGGEFIDDPAVQSGNDFIYGGDGSDALYGLDGNDTIYGGGGSDNFIVTFTTTGAGVAVSVRGGLFGGAGNDHLDGGDGDDYLDGGEGNDTLIGGVGSDQMHGGAGNDTVFADSGRDTVFGEDGNDSIYCGGLPNSMPAVTAYGGSGDDFIFGGVYSDLIYGDDGADTETGNDFIWGGDGRDDMLGGNGNDNICGYFGSDYFRGGNGNDFFNLTYDVNMGDRDYIFDLMQGDYVLLPKWTEGRSYFFEQGGYAYGYVGDGSGSYYLFGVLGLTAAELASVTYYF